MGTTASATDVGAPDPERRTSPIFDESDDEPSLDLELEEGTCFFNDRDFSLGSYVCSGNELLQCRERGVWVRMGTCAEE